MCILIFIIICLSPIVNLLFDLSTKNEVQDDIIWAIVGSSVLIIFLIVRFVLTKILFKKSYLNKKVGEVGWVKYIIKEKTRR